MQLEDDPEAEYEAALDDLEGKPSGKRNCRDERFAWRMACENFPDVAAERDFPRFMRYARRVKGVTLSAREMRELLAGQERETAPGERRDDHSASLL